MRLQTDIQLRKSYQDLSIPFNIFIEILVNNDLSKLIIEGQYNVDELQYIWERIYNQFIENVGSDDVKLRLEQVKDIVELETRIKLAEWVINALNISYNDDIAELLNNFGYSLNIKPNENNIQRVIKIFMGFVNADILALKNKIAELPPDNKGDDEKPSRQYFEKMIVAIELAFKISINIDNISTGKYCEYVNSYNVWIKKVLTKKSIE